MNIDGDVNELRYMCNVIGVLNGWGLNYYNENG